MLSMIRDGQRAKVRGNISLSGLIGGGVYDVLINRHGIYTFVVGGQVVAQHYVIHVDQWVGVTGENGLDILLAG
jgi:hypothetical protein